MVTKSAVVLPYDEQWEQAFAHIKDKIQEALGSLALRIEHKNQPLVLRQGEIWNIQLLSCDQALSCFEHEGTRSVLTKAQALLTAQSEKN